VDEQLQRRFAAPLLVTVRPARGPLDAALLVEQTRDGSSGAVWIPGIGTRVASGPQVPGRRTHPDAATLLIMADDRGSEVGHVHAFPVDRRSRA
jgi:hypothetical protein